MKSEEQKTSKLKQAINVLRGNAVIKMFLGNNDLLSEDDVLDKYATNMQNAKDAKIAQELQNSLSSIDSNISIKQSRDELDKYKFSGTTKISHDKSSSSINKLSKSYEDDELSK